MAALTSAAAIAEQIREAFPNVDVAERVVDLREFTPVLALLFLRQERAAATAASVAGPGASTAARYLGGDNDHDPVAADMAG